MQRSKCTLLIFALIAALGLACGSLPLPAYGQDDIAKVANCPLCGMDRLKYASSRIYIPYADGTVFGACSIHCAAVELSVKIDKTPSAIQVGDFDTKELIDAESAVWVIGGDLPGVMTKRAKWAFGSPEKAQAFIARHGGVQATFEEAMKATYEDMYADTRMIRERRMQKRMMKMQESKEK